MVIKVGLKTMMFPIGFEDRLKSGEMPKMQLNSIWGYPILRIILKLHLAECQILRM